MPRPSLKLRKPGQAAVGLSPAEVEAFIEGGEALPTASRQADAATQAPERADDNPIRPLPVAVQPSSNPVADSSSGLEPVDVPTFRRANRSLARRKTKPDRRRTTVYMDLQLARVLAHHCHAQDEDMSDVVNRALAAWLDGSKAE